MKAETSTIGCGNMRPALWDCHVHVFEPAYPFAPVRAYTPSPATVTDLRAHLDRVGAGRAVLVQASPHGTDNRGILDALAALGPGHRAVLSPAPGLDAPALRRLHDRGVRGLRLNPLGRIERVSDAIVRQFRESAQLATDAGLVLELAATPRAILALADEITAARCEIALPHLAGLPTRGLSAELSARLMRLLVERRIWVKLSGFERFDAPERVAATIRALVAATPDRLIWGSDWPHTPLHRVHVVHDDRQEANRAVDDARHKAALKAMIEPDMRERIFVTNPATLFA